MIANDVTSAGSIDAAASSSVRANVLIRRTYNRDKGDGVYETWSETIDRTTRHQAWLWARALCVATPEDVFDNPSQNVIDDVARILDAEACAELDELRQLMHACAAMLSGRTLWLGGTSTARRRESSQFNCAFLEIETVYDLVDAAWLLLQGCGVGFKPIPGCLHGFSTYIPQLIVIPSGRKGAGGNPNNAESYDPAARRWTIRVGDSAEAWAKSLGKLVAGKYHNCRTLVIDFSQIRLAGSVIRGYGWLCQGDTALAAAYRKVFQILNRHAGQMLPFAAIHDIVNLFGTVLSSRRSALLALCDYGAANWREFAEFKQDYHLPGVNRPWREQSNNTLDFDRKPSRGEMEEVFQLMVASGGSEPGFRNAEAAARRAPWARGTNPCGEILLPNRGFCNLSEVNLAHPWHRNFDQLMRSLWLIARANYRQTCVNLEDGILQRAWHENNENLRLCGVGLTGIVQRNDLTSDALQVMRDQAQAGAHSMADELERPRPAAVTTVKPSGTLSKIMNCCEGMHRPLGMYLFNHVEFSRLSSLPGRLAEHGYVVIDHPTKPDALLVRFPVAWEDVAFDRLPDGREANLESAVAQLERYRTLLRYWSDHNVSCTISYEPNEVPQLVDWFDQHWDECVSVSLLFRAHPASRAKQLGYSYLPQEVVTKEEYDAYVTTLKPFELEPTQSDDVVEDVCKTGACPTR